ncbi:MAG TPA: AarF/ABC1/UbiB kinase family protein [Nocardioides sp.]|nr:AarF/ABC1/UbiB kinase family protein [Nocardioides sp.]
MAEKGVRTSRFGRLSQLGVMASGQAARQVGTRTANSFRSPEDADAAIMARNLEMADRLVEVLGTMRGAAQKLGQTLSMLDGGLIPAEHRAEFQAKLAALQASAPKVPWSKMQAQIEQAVGGRIADAFREFDTTPVAAASIGQVYRAVHRDGRDVAVKVQYPGIERAVRADLKNLSLFMRVYGRLVHEGLDAKQLAAELEARIIEELDYELEADNTRLLAAAYRGHPFIRIPDVVGEYSDERVLTTEWIDGKPLSSVVDADLETRNRVAEILFRFYSGTPYRLRMYSGDPHPGNSLVLEDGSIGFLDFGLFKRVAQSDADAELAGFRAAFEGDADRVLAIAHERGFVPDLEGTDKDELLAHTLTAGWWYFHDETVEITSDRVNAVAARFADPRRAEYRFALKQNLPPEHAFRTRAEAQLAAILGQLSPRINLHRVAREWAYGDEPATELGTLQRAWDEEVRHVTG